MRGKEDLEKQEDEIAQHEREELYNKTAKLLNI